MGVKSVLGWDPVRATREFLGTADEKARRRMANTRRLLLQDDAEGEIRRQISKVFTDATVKERTLMFAALASSANLFRRVIAERARPVYLVPAVRTVSAGQEQFRKLEAETYLDEVCSRWLVAALGTTGAWAFPRYVERLDKIVVDVAPADSVTVIPDPDDPCRALAVIADKPVWLPTGEQVVWYVYRDDEISFQLDHNGNVVPFSRGEQQYRPNPFGRIMGAQLHPYERFGQYWAKTGGASLMQANMAIATLTTLALRKLKARGFNQIVVSGDVMRFPKGQAMDEESALLAPDGSEVTELGSEADAKNYLDMIEALENRAAAEYGINRARLNQDSGGDDVGLLEHRAEMVKLMRDAETELFEVLKLVSQETTDRQVPKDARLTVDFGEVELRSDPEAELRVWDAKRKMGVRSVLDQVKSENPEIRTDEDAWEELDRNFEAESEFVRRRRALNAPADATAQQAGQNPTENGALGPAVRDGEMTRDDAADYAAGG